EREQHRVHELRHEELAVRGDERHEPQRVTRAVPDHLVVARRVVAVEQIVRVPEVTPLVAEELGHGVAQNVDHRDRKDAERVPACEEPGRVAHGWWRSFLAENSLSRAARRGSVSARTMRPSRAIATAVVALGALGLVWR